MATIILGHGGTEGENVLIPPGMVLNVYSDVGEALMIPTQPNGDFDYSGLASAWDHYKPYGSLTERMVTTNLELGPLDPSEIQHAQNLDWGGATILMVGDALTGDTKLCTGDENSCPTPQLLVQENENPGSVPPERWYHTCDGFLGTLGQQTDGDLHWVSCTSIMAAAPVLDEERDLEEAAPS